MQLFALASEPLWPSGKALGWSAEGPRFESASALLSRDILSLSLSLSSEPVWPSSKALGW